MAEYYILWAYLKVCPFASISPKIHVLFSPICFYTLLMAVAQFCTSGVVICYVIPVLWMTLDIKRADDFEWHSTVKSQKQLLKTHIILEVHAVSRKIENTMKLLMHTSLGCCCWWQLRTCCCYRPRSTHSSTCAVHTQFTSRHDSVIVCAKRACTWSTDVIYRVVNDINLPACRTVDGVLSYLLRGCYRSTDARPEITQDGRHPAGDRVSSHQRRRCLSRLASTTR